MLSSMLFRMFNLEDNMCQIVPSDLEFHINIADQSICFFEFGILVPSLRTCAPGGQLHPYRKDRWQLLFILVVIKVERKTVMTAWRLH